MRSAPNFGDLLLDRRPSHFVPPEMRDRRLRVLPSASGSGPVSFARRVWMHAMPPAMASPECRYSSADASSRILTPVATTIVTVALRRLGGSGPTRRRGALRCLGGQT